MGATAPVRARRTSSAGRRAAGGRETAEDAEGGDQRDSDDDHELAAAGLRYVNCDEPGLGRRRCGRGFAYLDQHGRVIRQPALRRRLKSLAVPPAWVDVWFCRDPRGHIQATGRDERGRKQYVYHPDWRELRDRAKFAQLPSLAGALKPLRTRLEKDLRRRSAGEEAVLAAAAQMLDLTAIRVGNRDYYEQNGTVGLTTLEDRHARINGDHIGLRFKAKSGQPIRITVSDRRLSRILLRCEELPGQRLFRYRSADGVREVDSVRFNDYLREVSGADVTAKDFRTWIATVTVVEAWLEAEPAALPLKIKDATSAAAKRLHNTPAVARRSYIHPEILEIVTTRAPSAGERRIARHDRAVLSGPERLCRRLLTGAADAAARSQ